MKSNAPFWGLVCGLVTIFALYPFGTLDNWGVHAGIFGLAVNLLVVCIISASGSRKAQVGDAIPDVSQNR